MLEEIAGLPVHPLIVHATVVLVPLAAALVALAALLPRVRRWAGVLPALAAAAALVLVPLTVRSGEALLAQLRPGEDGLIIFSGCRSATFLPQVWEQLPEPQQFLAALKHKAGLPTNREVAGLMAARYHVRKWKETEAEAS